MSEQTQLPDFELLAYLDGAADADIVAAIEANTAQYAERLAQLRVADAEINASFAAQLRGLDVPTDEELGDYALGLLTKPEANRIEKYVQRHPHAAKRLALFNDFMADLEPKVSAEPKPSLLDQAQVLIAQLLGGGSSALAGVRGAQEGVYAVGDYRIVVETDDDMDAPTRFVLDGMLMGVDESLGFVAQLWRANEPEMLTSAELDDMGNFSFNGLDAGAYEIIISGSDIEIHIQNVTV